MAQHSMTQGATANKLRTRAATKVAPRCLQRPGNCLDCAGHCVNRAQPQWNIARGHGGTLMRHFILSGAVTAGSLGVRMSAATRALVTLTRRAHRVATRSRGARAGAINLTAVTVAANHHLHPASSAQKQSARRFHWRPKSRQREFDRPMPIVKYSARTCAWHGVGHDIGLDLVV